MQIDYLKILCKEDVHIYHTNFTKKWNKIHMEQLAGGKLIENDCFSRTLKFKMLFQIFSNRSFKKRNFSIDN
jgi:hypothetical protein